jgi:hypothetical protein
MRSSLLGVGALSVTGLVGCGLPSSADTADAEAASQNATAIVVVERSVGPGEATRGDAVVARFLRVRQGAVDDPALRIAGVPDVPSAAKGCWVPSGEAPYARLAGRQVDLLDVGTVTLESAQARTTLYSRAMPDPANVVSGTFYSARATDAFATGSLVQLRATGGLDLVDGFAVSIPAPRDLGEVTVASTTAGLDVAWDATDVDARDVVYLDVLSSSQVLARCATADAGRFIVPLSAVGAIEDGELAVHRLHREAFHAKGVDPGEVRFDVSRVTAFHR